MNRKTYTASTTCPGFEFKPLKLVTKADFYRLCMRLQEMFGKGWEFEPDTALEGGIKVTNWPGKIGEMKKLCAFGTVIQTCGTGVGQHQESSKNGKTAVTLFGTPCHRVQERIGVKRF